MLKLLKATSVLNTEQDNLNRSDEDRIQHKAENVDTPSNPPTSTTNAASAEEEEVNLKLSGNHDLSQLTAGQVDRLEQGFQQAITDDRRLHRMYVYLDGLYAGLAR